MLDKKEIIAELTKMGISVQNGKIKKSDVKAALSIIADRSKTPAEKAKELGLNNPAAENVITAYSDSFDDVKAKRNLDYFEDSPVNGSELVEIMSKVVPGYNDFDGAKSTQQLVNAFGNEANYHIAREGSVCVYVKPSANLRLQKLANIKSDEASFDVDKMMFRFWWD